MNEREKRQLIEDYLSRLERALSGVNGGARRELVEDVRGHLEEAWAASSDHSRAALLNILERLGDPETLAAEQRERLGPAEPPSCSPSYSGPSASCWPGSRPAGACRIS